MDQHSEQPSVQQIFGNIALMAMTIILPETVWSIFGWLYLLLPLLVFAFLIKYGVTIGSRFVIAGTGLAAIISLLVPSLSLPLFSFSMLPAGFMLARSAEKGESPPLAGAKSTATLVFSWGLLVAILAISYGKSPYGSLLQSLNVGIEETLSQYRQSTEIAPEAMMMLETTLHQMQVVIPIILPAIFCCCAILAIWLTMALGNRLAPRLAKRTVWPQFRLWQLPDRLIWIAIGSALITVVPGLPRNIAVNLLLVLSAVYCLQGFSLCVFFMNKWRVPPLLRSFIYVMIVFQSFGTLILLMAGVADIWFDFRKLNPKDHNEPQQD